MKLNKILLLFASLLTAGCSYENAVEKRGSLLFTTSIESFEGEAATRTDIAGEAFENGDKIKLKIICPFSSHTEYGETTYSGSFDGFWLLKWNSGAWATLKASDGFDINGDYSPSASPDIYERYEAQQTPYVYTAQTWSEEQIFIAGDGANTRVEQYSNVFHADQSKAADYKASDLMWAQTVQQTGSYNVHLSFRHVMAAVAVVVECAGISENAVLTLEGMPEIDQREVIVGDYYAAKSKVNSNNYGYKSKHSCGVDKNGVVIGVASVDDALKKAVTVPFEQIAQSATYTAYNAGGKVYRLIVPPCELAGNAVLWLRDGAKRYSMQLSQTTFEAGKLYKVTLKVNDSDN